MLRDIYVQNTSTDHWDEFLSFIRSRGYTFSYKRNGSPADLPGQASTVLSDRQSAHNLSIDIGNAVTLNCHFFESYEIELDLDPKEIGSQAELVCVLDFLRDLGSRLAKDVLVTEENSEDLVLMKFDWQSEEFTVRSRPG
ncbi:MAG: hypothetical protein HKN11_19860 [Rhizobiales bacterium]|nr:hypothetical protein [Hyphomicrobiales bacterium]